MEPPLLVFEPYLQYKRAKASPKDYLFDHSTADTDILQMRTDGNDELADQCELPDKGR